MKKMSLLLVLASSLAFGQSKTEDAAEQHRIYLQRCVALAKEGLERGNNPFGSLLLSGNGTILFEGHNRDGETGNSMLHPELAIAQWAAANMTPEERSKATVYTSGEHCAMCAGAHAWVGLGKIVYASSTEQLEQWLTEFNVGPSPLSFLPIRVVAPAIQTEGPFKEFADVIRELHRKRFSKQ